VCGYHRLDKHRLERDGCDTVPGEYVAPTEVGSSCRGEPADAQGHCGHAKRSLLRKRFVDASTAIKRDRHAGGVAEISGQRGLRGGTLRAGPVAIWYTRRGAHRTDQASTLRGGYAHAAATDPAADAKADPAACRGTATPNRTAAVPPTTAGGTPTTTRSAAPTTRGTRARTRGTRTTTRGTRTTTGGTPTGTGAASFAASAAGPCPARTVRQEPATTTLLAAWRSSANSLGSNDFRGVSPDARTAARPAAICVRCIRREGQRPGNRSGCPRERWHESARAGSHR